MKYGPLFGICSKHRTPEDLIENILQFENAGAHGVVINFDELDRQYWTFDHFKAILSAGKRVETYACFYRNKHTTDLNDETRAEYLLMASLAGADIVDVMGDLFDPTPFELSLNPEAVAKQKALIARLKQNGSTVLMSSHILQYRSYEDTLKYFHTHLERGADISKAVFACTSQEELMESRRVSDELCANFPMPFVYVCSGEFGKKFQRYETLLNGSLMTFVRLNDNDTQPGVKQALEYMRRHTPWAAAAERCDCGEFIGKTAVITGGASGMGLLASKRFAALGASVLMVDINKDALENAANEIREQGGRAIAVTADVRKYSDAANAAETAIKAFGRIDYLLCFAGGYEPRCCKSNVPFYEQPIEVIDWGIDVNLKGAVYFARACMPAMIKQNYGVFVCLGSVSGVEGNGKGPMYGTSKNGLSQFVKGVALAGAPHNVRAVCVAPGPVMTRKGMAAMKTPLGRAAEPIEVVDFIMQLCSDRSSFITGSTHFIDGGYLCNFGR